MTVFYSYNLQTVKYNKNNSQAKLNLTQLKYAHRKKIKLSITKLESVEEKVEKWLNGSITDNKTETEEHGNKRAKGLKTSISVHLPHNNVCI